MLFLLLAVWIGLTAFTWYKDRMPKKLEWDLVETPVFTALLEPEVPDTVLDDPDFDFDEEDTILASATTPKNTADPKDDTENPKPGQTTAPDSSSNTANSNKENKN